jgi:O-Antigen ligase
MEKLKRTPYIASLIFLAYMPFHIFLSQWLSTYTGGLDLWKIAKDLLLFAATLFTICLVWWQGKGNKTFNRLVVLTALYGVLHLVLWITHPAIYGRSAELGIIYNMRLPLSLLLGYGTVLLRPKFAFSSLIKVILIVSTLVTIFGILQYFLPGDLLTHFGYSIARGTRPVFYIDDNHTLPIRIISTLREPNALAAYLIVPATILGALLLRIKDNNKRLILGGALALHLLAIVLTDSRSGLAGVMLSLMLVVWWQYQTWFVKQLKTYWLLVVILLVVAGASLFSVRNTAFYQHYVVHGHSSSQPADLDSNQYHSLYIKQGLQGIHHVPLGHGPGTAGLASIQNPKGGQLTENYYLQIGYETGIEGLLLFVGLNVWLYMAVWRRHNYLAIVLCASFWSYVLMNMLLHTWENEAVAVQWWILAGMVAAMAGVKRGTKKTKQRA